jgi:hypothetical protein
MHTTNRSITTISLLLFFGIIAVAGTRASVQASDVIVTNSTSQPVPTTVQGTPNVRSLQGGTWSVYLLGSPTLRINNATSAPIPTNDVTGPDKQPFSFAKQYVIPNGTAGSMDSFVVPPGKRLFIDSVSGSAYDATPGNNAQVFKVSVVYSGSGFRGDMYVPLTPLPDGYNVVGNQLTKLLAEPGDTVYVVVKRDYSHVSGEVDTDVTLVGHYTSVP